LPFEECGLESYLGGVSGKGDWEGFKLDSIRSPLDGKLQKFYFYQATKKNMPLVVSLHQWSSDYTNYKNSLAPQTRAKDWNYIHPDFRGPNNNPKACGSEFVISDIDQIINWAVNKLDADTTNIYIVGASGGGFTALCHLLRSQTKYRIREYSVWVPITDLGRWYKESKSRGSKYAQDVIQCTCNHKCEEPDFRELRKRSPLYSKLPVKKLEYTRVKIHAGIHDGYTGAVPIVHSALFYNKVVDDLGGRETDKMSMDDLCWMFSTRSAPDKIAGKLGDRDILWFKKFKNVSLTIFEGGHEILVDSILSKYRR
jgi:hypothetical protein